VVVLVAQVVAVRAIPLAQPHHRVIMEVLGMQVAHITLVVAVVQVQLVGMVTLVMLVLAVLEQHHL
tara:strand:+ start:165 stop:362 length:198 start_codon:yes stop_codon:yes gene_type:complete